MYAIQAQNNCRNATFGGGDPVNYRGGTRHSALWYLVKQRD